MTKENIDIHKKIDGWTVKDASLKLGISESTMKDWCKKNNIKRQPIVKGRKGAYILSKEDLIKSTVEIPKVISKAKQELTIKL